MGTWGTAISSNDTFADVYEEFFEFYNEGLKVEDISKRLIKNNHEIINDRDDCNNFWFALAKAHWECKELDKDVFSRVKNIIESGSDIEIWRQLNADDKDLKKRKSVLEKFLSDISTERSKAKTRKKAKKLKIIEPVFEKGDCIIYKLENGNFGGSVVLEAIYNGANTFVNLIVTTRLDKAEKPSIKDFEESTVLIKNFSMSREEPNIHWYSPIRHNKILSLLEIIGKTQVDKTYTHYVNNSTPYGFCEDFDIWILDQSNRQFAFEKENQKSNKVITIKELIKES